MGNSGDGLAERYDAGRELVLRAGALAAEYAGRLAELDVRRRAERWRTTLVDGGTAVRVACRGAEVIGWSSSGVGRDADRPEDLELEGVYVLASAHGTGVGQALLDAAVGERPAYLWVAERNPRAHRFYRRNGFVPDGTRAVKPLAGHPVAVVRLVRRVSTP